MTTHNSRPRETVNSGVIATPVPVVRLRHQMLTAATGTRQGGRFVCETGSFSGDAIAVIRDGLGALTVEVTRTAIFYTLPTTRHLPDEHRRVQRTVLSALPWTYSAEIVGQLTYYNV